MREELATAERRAEEERIAHNATKMVILSLHFLTIVSSVLIGLPFVATQAAVEREVELEHRAVEASNALARIQVILQGITVIMIHL